MRLPGHAGRRDSVDTAKLGQEYRAVCRLQRQEKAVLDNQDGRYKRLNQLMALFGDRDQFASGVTGVVGSSHEASPCESGDNVGNVRLVEGHVFAEGALVDAGLAVDCQENRELYRRQAAPDFLGPKSKMRLLSYSNQVTGSLPEIIQNRHGRFGEATEGATLVGQGHASCKIEELSGLQRWKEVQETILYPLDGWRSFAELGPAFFGDRDQFASGVTGVVGSSHEASPCESGDNVGNVRLVEGHVFAEGALVDAGLAVDCQENRELYRRQAAPDFLGPKSKVRLLSYSNQVTRAISQAKISL